MIEYNEKVKDLSRDIIWKYSIKSLTNDRKNIGVITEEYVRDFWDYIYNKSSFTSNELSCENVDNLNNWADFYNNNVGSKNAKDLKVAYLCGPNPQNDLKYLLDLGVRIENIWAIESDDIIYNNALHEVIDAYNDLKIFHGNIKDFFNITSLRFDIIYLDFTLPIISKKSSPVRVFHYIFDNNLLEDLGIIITNYPLPQLNEKWEKTLFDFYYDSNAVEYKLYDKNKKDQFIEGPQFLGYSEDDFTRIIIDNFENFYSSFITLYPIYYSNVFAPRAKVINCNPIRNSMFKDRNLINQILSSDVIDFKSDSMLLKRIYTNDMFKKIYDDKPLGYTYNKYNSVKIITYLINNWESIKGLLDENFVGSVQSLYDSIDFYEYKRYFCDMLFPEEILNFIFCQLGDVYHCNLNNHKRFKYTAKTNTMMVDIFTFDKCKSFYNWMPLFDLYGPVLKSLDKQILFRACLDSIGKKIERTMVPLYSTGVNAVGVFETPWAIPVNKLPERFHITD